MCKSEQSAWAGGGHTRGRAEEARGARLARTRGWTGLDGRDRTETGPTARESRAMGSLWEWTGGERWGVVVQSLAAAARCRRRSCPAVQSRQARRV